MQVVHKVVKCNVNLCIVRACNLEYTWSKECTCCKSTFSLTLSHSAPPHLDRKYAVCLKLLTTDRAWFSPSDVVFPDQFHLRRTQRTNFFCQMLQQWAKDLYVSYLQIKRKSSLGKMTVWVGLIWHTMRYRPWLKLFESYCPFSKDRYITSC